MKWRDGKEIKKDKEKINTIIGDITEIKGNIIAKGSIRIDGKIEGGVFSEQTIVIGEKGLIKGDINASEINCSGVIYGNVSVKNKLELMSSGQIYGDISTESLVIHEKAVFEGNCIMKKQKQLEEPEEEITEKGEEY